MGLNIIQFPDVIGFLQNICTIVHSATRSHKDGLDSLNRISRKGTGLFMYRFNDYPNPMNNFDILPFAV